MKLFLLHRKRVISILLLIIYLSSNLFGQEIISSGELSIEIFKRASGVEISSIKKNNTELLNTSVASELFTLSINNEHGVIPKFINSFSGWDSVAIVNNGADCSITLTHPSDSDLSHNLKVIVTIATENKKSEWKISVLGLVKYSLYDVVFPQINIKAEGNDYLLLPHYSGKEIPNPKSMNITSKLIYPLGWDASMQFSAYYNDDYGIYFGTHDPKASLKSFVVKAENNGIVYKNIIPIPNKTINGNDWEMSGVFQLELFNGNWYDASQIYRKWVSAEADYWPSDTPKREVRQNALGSIGVWAYAFSEPNEPMTQIEDEFSSFADYFPGVTVGIHWYQWNYLDFDNDYPNYFPELAGMKDLVSKVQSEHNVLIMPYINGRLFDEDLPNYPTDGFPYATKNISGTTYTQNFNGNTFSVMCPTQDNWQNILTDASSQLTDRIKCSGIYLDQVCASTPVECMDTTHNHTLGGGNWWREGYNTMFENIHSTLLPDKFVTVEGGCDYLTDEVDGFLVGGWKSNNLVPAFSAVYSGKVQLLARATSTANYHNQAYYCKLTQALTFGIQPGRASTWVVHDSNAKIAKPFLRQIATMRYKLKDFLSFGRMLRPIIIEQNIPNITSTWTDYGDEEIPVTISALQSSVWKDKKNRIAILFANASMDNPLQFTFNFDGSNYGMIGELAVTEVTENLESPSSNLENSFSKNVSLQPLKVVTFVIKADSITAIKNKNDIIKSYELENNYPNPFNPTTSIGFTIPNTSNIKLEVYNSLGQKVSVLVNKKLSKGSYKYNFNSNNLSTGVYYYKLETEKFSQTKKMLLIK